ncbi:MAG: DUF2863 family protein [Burkholderiaceae bacterium]
MATKRPRNKSSLPRLSRDGERLASLAQSLSASGSRVEESYWEQLVGNNLQSLLDFHADTTIDAVLDHLDATSPSGFDALIELVEAHAEATTLQIDDQDWTVLLVAAPILAWSRYSVPSGPIKADVALTLETHLRAHCAASDAKIALAPYLYSIDQLPRSFSDVHALGRSLGRRALGHDEKKASGKRLPETAPLLADTRYLLAAFVAKPGAPLFRWQELPDARGAERREYSREQALERWRDQGLPTLTTLMPGCVLDLLIPDGYHVASRESDRAIRPYAIRAAIAFLESALDVKAPQLRAVIAAFGNDMPEEYRVGFTLARNPDVVHGVVWPLFGREEGPEPDGPEEQLAALLRENGLTDIVTLEQSFPLEFCDDCGAPLFADPVGDLVHAELPEETEAPRAHLH